MTEQRLKDILKIEKWSEINDPQKFLQLMIYYYALAPGVKIRILSSIHDLDSLNKKFKEYCASSILEYEPSIMIVISKLMDELSELAGKSGTINSKEKREQLSYIYADFSEWFGMEGEVKCTIGQKDFICNIGEAIELAFDNEKDGEKSDLKMIMLTGERERLMREQEMKLALDSDKEMDFLKELLGDDMGLVSINKKSSKKYIN